MEISFTKFAKSHVARCFASSVIICSEIGSNDGLEEGVTGMMTLRLSEKEEKEECVCLNDYKLNEMSLLVE